VFTEAVLVINKEHDSCGELRSHKMPSKVFKSKTLVMVVLWEQQP
jgi:hypothetical protein